MNRLPSDPRRSELLADGLFALVVTVFAQINLRFDIDQSTHYGSMYATALATAAATSVLALRRRAPLLTAVVVALAVAGPELFGRLTITLWGDFVPLVIATYSVARHARARAAALGTTAAAVAMIVIWLRIPVIATAANIPFTVIPLVTAFVAGRGLRRRHQRHQEVRDRARKLEEDRDEAVRAAVATERARIARDLHDIIAHCVSVMVVQAGAAEDLLDRDPAKARGPLRSVQDTGGQAVAELSRMLGLLRDDEAKLALTPQPGTAQLGDLVEHMTRIGLPVTLTVEGEPVALPPGVDLAVYRITQEALTNTLKHAAPAKAEVVLRYREQAVELDVTDTGRRTGPPGNGHGLIGMRERVSLYGGTLSTGERPEGGYAVHAHLPLDGRPR